MKYGNGKSDACHMIFDVLLQYPYPEISKQREYHDFLASQIEEKNRNTRLGQLEEKRQAREVGSDSVQKNKCNYRVFHTLGHCIHKLRDHCNI